MFCFFKMKSYFIMTIRSDYDIFQPSWFPIDSDGVENLLRLDPPLCRCGLPCRVSGLGGLPISQIMGGAFQNMER